MSGQVFQGVDWGEQVVCAPAEGPRGWSRANVCMCFGECVHVHAPGAGWPPRRPAW